MAMQVRHARRLAAVKAMILEEPRRFDMSMWAMESDSAPCGTAACIGGFLVWRAHGLSRIREYLRWLRGEEIEHLDICDRASELLGLYEDETEELFYVDYWPGDLAEDYRHTLDLRDYRRGAEIACQRIDLFLADHGFGPDCERLPKVQEEGVK